MTSVTAGYAAGRPRGRERALAGTGTLIRFILRRDRVRLPVWIVLLVGFTVMSVASFPDIYATAAARQARAELMRNPVAVVFTGPGYGLDHYTFGAMTANEMFASLAIAVALMNILLVTRHTRAEEESGRAELIRATVVGRHATVTATLIVVGGADVAIGALLALGLPAALPELPLVGSVAFGAGAAAVGLVFAGIAAAAAQVTEHARGAIGLGCAALGVTFALRVAGDMGEGTRSLSWLSPFGWSQSARAYVDERWWPLLISLAAVMAIVAAAFAVNARRDVGAGLVRQRPGPAAAGRTLNGPLGLALRLQRGSIVAWGTGIVALGLTYGMMGSEVTTFVASNPALADLIGAASGVSIVDSFFATLLQMIAMLAACFAISATSRTRGEETEGRAETVLAGAVPRWRWAAGHLTVATAGSAAILVLAGLGMGVTAAASTGDPAMVPDLTGAVAAYIPAVWLIVGLVVALLGLAPRAVAAVWAVLAYVVVVGMLGGLLRLPDWAYDLSPFERTPQLPAAEPAAVPFVVITAVAACLTALGLAALRRRDLHSA